MNTDIHILFLYSFLQNIIPTDLILDIIICRFTQKNILRIYPKGTRFNSSNYKPLVGWMHGAQMVAFNMQVFITYSVFSFSFVILTLLKCYSHIFSIYVNVMILKIQYLLCFAKNLSFSAKCF